MVSRLSVRARFTFLYGMAMTATVVLLCGGIYFFVQRALMGQVENHLRKDFSTIGEYLKDDPAGLSKVADHGPILLFRVQEGMEPLVASENWISEKLGESISNQHPERTSFSMHAANGKQYRVLTGTATAGTHSYRITVAHHEDSVKQTRKTLALIILLTLPIAVAISLAIGYVIAGRVLAPITTITRKAEEISAENLSERLPIGETDDEFNRLATVFNQTFARIEDSFDRLRRFTADASHELRTPLAAIRSIGETAMHTPEEQLNSRETIGSILEESDRLRQLVDALLTLSRADAGEIGARREAVDLAELARDTVDLMNVLAEEKHQSISITTHGTAIAKVDRASVRQAITNLLDNAIKYSPAESDILISIGVTNHNEAFVEIADSGIGIPEQDIQRIFDRFYRVDKGRSREVGGAGLGLSIAKWAVEINGGRIEVESTCNQGSIFRVVFSRL
jgi:heavy metal sensor kinase